MANYVSTGVGVLPKADWDRQQYQASPEGRADQEAMDRAYNMAHPGRYKMDANDKPYLFNYPEDMQMQGTNNTDIPNRVSGAYGTLGIPNEVFPANPEQAQTQPPANNNAGGTTPESIAQENAYQASMTNSPQGATKDMNIMNMPMRIAQNTMANGSQQINAPQFKRVR